MIPTSFFYRMLFLAGAVALSACKQGPNEATLNLKPTHEHAVVHGNIRLDVHKIEVQAVLPSEKYLYLKVMEGDRSYWVATRPTKIVEGESYLYNEALIETDFKSEELGRVFDTLYLVTRMVPQSEADGLGPSDLARVLQPTGTTTESDRSHGKRSAAKPLEISEILESPRALEGQWVEISGTCVKVNSGILKRNWVHLADNKSGKEIVVTTQDNVREGDQLTFVAKVGVDRDFGSGYSYPVLLEEGARRD